jgi:DNA-binding NtrC family response regulator
MASKSEKKDLIVRGLKDIALQKKILVVAAQDNIGELLSDILIKEGYFVSIVESWGVFEEVLSELKDEQYNMVLLTNNSLQPHHILDLVSKIKRQYPSLCIFVLSGYKEKDFIVNLKQQGIDEFLSMPFKSDNLISKMKRIFSNKSSRLKEKNFFNKN